jgi:hypothetical protein
MMPLHSAFVEELRKGFPLRGKECQEGFPETGNISGDFPSELLISASVKPHNSVKGERGEG